MTATPVYPKAKRELVRLLSKEHGHKVASELSGVPYDLVRQWSSRDNRKAKSQSVTMDVQSAVEVTKEIANNVESELAENERETRLSLARSTRRLAKDSESVTLRDSKHVKNVAQTASIVHKWDTKQSQPNVMVNIALLGVDPGEVQASGTIAEDEA